MDFKDIVERRKNSKARRRDSVVESLNSHAVIYLKTGEKVLIDSDFADTARIFPWSYRGNRDNNKYVAACVTYGKNKKRYVLIHHLIIGKKDGFVVDHINGNTLDNRKSNLRHVTPSENSTNGKSRKSHDYSAPVGVTIGKKFGKELAYRVRVKIDGKMKHVGWYDSLEEASEVAKREHLKQYGENSFYAREMS